jgi:hypothetical protein
MASDVMGLPRASLKPTTHHEALDWASRVVTNGGSVSTTTVRAVSDFCAAIDRAGLRNKFWRLNLVCGQQLEAARVPVYLSTSYGGTTVGNQTDTNTGYTGSDYIETGTSAGLFGGTGKHLNTGVTNDTIDRSDCHALVYAKDMGTSTANDEAVLGCEQSGGGVFILQTRASNASGFVSNRAYAAITGLTGEVNGSPIVQSGSFALSATAATSLAVYGNGALTGSSSVNRGSGGAGNTRPVFVGAYNAGGAAVIHSPSRIRAYSIGLGLTAAQMLTLHDAIHAFQSRLSRAL